MILGQIFERNAAFYGQAPAIHYQDRVVTHAQLLDRGYRLANALRDLGLRKGDRVLLLAHNCLEHLDLTCAASVTGLTSVGLNYRLSAKEQVHIVDDCRPAVWIFEAQHAERVAEVCQQLASVPHLICIGAAALGAQEYEQLLQRSSDAKPILRASEQDTILISYTSGTTNRPKGVMHSHFGQVEQAKICSNAFAASPTDRALIVMPFYHLGAFNIYLAYAWTGASVVIHREFDAAKVYDSLERHRITAVLLAPVMIKMMVDAPAEMKARPNCLHTIYYSSAPMPVPLLKRAMAQFGPIFVQVYGMTESMLGTFMYKHQHKPEGAPHEVKRLASAGQPYFGVEIVVRRPDGSSCEPGEVGEITILSPALMQGYWNNTVATLETILDGWCHTGDLGYFDEDKFLFVVDRKKDMIISGGENIYSREVEEALLTHPAVVETAVIGVPDPKWGESVMAFVVCRGERPDPAELISHCRNQIAGYKKPSAIQFLDALPRVPSTNKVDKKALRAPYWAAPGSTS